MTPLEKDIEKYLVRSVRHLGGLCLKWVCPGWSGVPDRIILMPGGRIWFVELKRPAGGKVSKLQKWWETTLQDLGFRHEYVYNHADARRLVADLEEE